jgi:DNA repair ATPase RecN
MTDELNTLRQTWLAAAADARNMAAHRDGIAAQLDELRAELAELAERITDGEAQLAAAEARVVELRKATEDAYTAAAAVAGVQL